MRQRARLYESTGAVGRATRLHEETSPTLARTLHNARSLARADLERLFEQELSTLDEQNRIGTVAVLDVLTGPEAWSALRERHRLGVDDSVRCIVDSVLLRLGVADA